jgi:hypothetical protein
MLKRKSKLLLLFESHFGTEVIQIAKKQRKSTSALITNCTQPSPTAMKSNETEKQVHKVTDKTTKGKSLHRIKILEPWLGWILNGPKTHEGRLRRGFWAKVRSLKLPL